MEKTYSEMERPEIWRKDRFWLAIDHTVDPRINDQAKPKSKSSFSFPFFHNFIEFLFSSLFFFLELIEVSEKFAKEAGVVDFYGPNQTILHTDFYRNRAQPGMLICGADSHSPSAG